MKYIENKANIRRIVTHRMSGDFPSGVTIEWKGKIPARMALPTLRPFLDVIGTSRAWEKIDMLVVIKMLSQEVTCPI
jgi:hypothetical protein